MPKKFSDIEKEYIKSRLKAEAMKCLNIYGVKKTTVDELVRRVNIPKGTFYLFYESKELLLFDAINDLHDAMQKKLINDMQNLNGKMTVDNISDFLLNVFKEVKTTGLLSIMLNGELELLMRKLPDALVKEHLSHDDLSLEQLFSFIPHKEGKDISTYSGAFRGVFLSMSYQREIGEEIFDEAMRLLLRGLVIQMMEEE